MLIFLKSARWLHKNAHFFPIFFNIEYYIFQIFINLIYLQVLKIILFFILFYFILFFDPWLFQVRMCVPCIQVVTPLEI